MELHNVSYGIEYVARPLLSFSPLKIDFYGLGTVTPYLLDGYGVLVFRMNRRDLPKDIPLDSVVVLRYEKRSKSENKGKVLTEIELVPEQTQQGTSYEVSISAEGVEELKRKVKIKGEKKEALLTLWHKLEHQSDTQVITVKMEIMLEPTSNKIMVDALVIRTASAAVKPCQGDSLEFYLITGSIYIDQRGIVVIATIFDEVTKTLLSISVDYH
ncbi:hypothetical protein Tco_0084740 [Tanacetum coccineum]